MNGDNKGYWIIMRKMFVAYASQPVYWIGFFVLPLFIYFFMGSFMNEGLPQRIPSAIVDLDHTSTSRDITRNLAGMQMVDITEADESFTQARHSMQEGKIFGYFLIPRDFEKNFKAGKNPTVTFYTNMTYYVPANLLFKTFKTGATYAKAGMLLEVAQDVGLNGEELQGLINPISVVTRPLGNPWLNYPQYLCAGFIPAAVQLMILLMTTFSLGETVKYGWTPELMRLGRGSILRVVSAILAPQAVIWIVNAFLLQSWLFGWLHFPMNGSWLWLSLSTVLFVFACQGFGVLLFETFPNMRLSLAISALMGILSFSLAAFSFPVESMYPALGIFSWLLPVRYNFLIYIDQALNGIDIYYSRFWFIAYFIFMVLPLVFIYRIRKAYVKPVYVP